MTFWLLPVTAPPSVNAGIVRPVPADTVPWITGLVSVLLVSVSPPARVARVPVVGRIKLVDAVAVRTIGNAPLVEKASAKVTLFVEARVRTSVPAKVMELAAKVVLSETVSVLPLVIASVPVVVLMVRPL